jgi:hypothetical protein
MKRPNELNDLLDELTASPDDVGSIDSSKAVVGVNKEEITLTAEECEKVFQSAKTVKQLFDALGSEKATLELHGLELHDEALGAAERLFTSVDEF